MKNINWSFVNTIAIIFLVVFFKFCDKADNPIGYGTNKTSVVNNYFDTTIYRTDTKVNNASVKVIEVPVPKDADTSAILQMYHNSYCYTNDVSDSNIVGTIFDSISRNKLLKQRLTYRLIKPYKTVTNTIVNTPIPDCPSYKFSLQVGAFAYSNLLFTGYGPQVNYANKKMFFGAGYDLKNKGLMLNGGINFVRTK